MASNPEIADRPFIPKSAVWNNFEFLKGDDGKPDKTQTICQICHKIIPRPPSSSTSAMLGHLKTHHDIDLSGELKKPHQQIGASTSNIDMEPMQEAEFSKVKDIMKRVNAKISQETELNKFLKGKICDLERSKMELVGVFGRTGDGKSSLINAIIGEKDLLPSGDISACTSVMIQVLANMIDSKYIAEIEFIPVKEWEDELWDFLKNPDSERNEEGDSVSDDDDIKEKISALYGEDIKNFTVVKDYMDKTFREVPEFRLSQKKILKCNTSSELSDKIAKYTRRDSEEETGSNTETRYWPLVKCVTIKIPNTSKLLQHVALIDLPGTGDCNKSRDEMWKKFVGDCSAVWIVSSDTSRVDSVKEPWEILTQTISLIGNGGECRSISFICTKSDVIDDKYKKSNEETRQYVLQKNKRVKEQVRKKFDKEKGVIKKHFSDDSGFFQVFTVTSKDINELQYLQKDDTEIPQLQQFVKDLNNHQSKTNYYVSGAYGILSLMKAANTPETGSLKADVCRDLERRLQDWIDDVDQTIVKCKEAFERCLDEGVRLSLESCESILKGVTKGKTVHHSMLKSLVQKNGIYKKLKNKRKTEVNLNERLSKHLRETIDQEFSKTFPNEGRPGPIKEAIDTFTLDTDSFSDEHEGVALQMTFLKTEEEKLKKKLANIIREKKKNIYSSLTNSIQQSMQPCYDKAAKLSGKGTLENMRQAMHAHLNTSKSTMFVKAKEHMLYLVESLKDKLLETLQKDMLTSIDQSLKTNDNSVPDVTEQYEEVKIIYDKLQSSSRRSANTGIKESTDSPSPSCLSMRSDKSMNPPINFKTQTWSPDLSSSKFIHSSHILQHIRCCKCSSIMTDPVSIPCGHSYCKCCINTSWTEPSPTGDYVCPLTPLCKKSYPVRLELSVNEALSSVLKVLLAQTGSGDVAWKKKKKKPKQLEAACDVCSSLKPRRAVKTCLTCSASYCNNHLREHNTVPALQKHTLTLVNEDTRLSKQECSSGRMGVNREEPSSEFEEHQGSACKRRKLAGEEEGEMFQHSSELEQSARNTQVYTQAEPQQEKHDLRKQPDVVKDRLFSEQIKVSSSQYKALSGGAIEMVSPASSPVQPQQDKPGDRRPQAEGPSVPKRTNSSLFCSDKQPFFTKYRGSLVSKVKNVESIVDDLRSAGFPAEMATKVQAENTAHASMRRILDSVTTTALEEALFKALFQHEPTLMIELLGEKHSSACKRRKLAGEEEGEMFQHSSELEQSARNTQVYTQAEPQQEKHDLRKQPDVVKDRLFSEQIKVSSSQYKALSGGAIEMVSPASSPVQPQQDKPGDRRPQAEGPSVPKRTNSSLFCSGIKKVASPARTAAPQLAVRPQQQTTIQLPPGFTIPPGMVLVRTETGKLVMVPQHVLAQAQAKTQQGLQGQTVTNIPPRPATPTAAATVRVSAPSPVPGTAQQTVRLASPGQTRMVQYPSPVGASTPKAITVAPVGTAMSVKMSAPQTVITAGATGQTMAKPGTVQTNLAPLNSGTAATVSNPAVRTTVVSQEMQENVKKCKNFLATLIKLASHNSKKNVKSLVQDLIDAKIEPEEFTTRLQAELNSSPQPYLIPFLKKSLPALRQSLLNNQWDL